MLQMLEMLVGHTKALTDLSIKTQLWEAGKTYPLRLCEFSEAKAPKEGLPVMVVDEEIYRRPPSLLIATVDKFAQMPWKGEGSSAR